jgi:P22 coat protein - gene protein 5
MAGNSLLTVDQITSEAVRLFKNSNLFIMNMDTQYDPAFAIDGAKIGSTLRIRLPNDYIVRQGPAMQLQNTTEQSVTLTVTDQRGVDVPFLSSERTMAIDDYSEIVIAPMINNLAGKVAAVVMLGSEGGVCNFVSNVDGTAAANSVSATGKIISPTSEQFLLGNAILDDNSADQMTRRIVNDPTTDARATVSLQGLLNPAPEISAQFRTGMMKSGLGYEKWFRDQTTIKHTAGTFSAGGTVNGGGQTTASAGGAITVNAITGTLKKGDFVTIDNVNAVNMVTKQTLGTLRQFCVTADAITGATSISLFPGIIGPTTAGGPDQQYQTVDSLPANSAQMRLLCQSGEVFRKSIAYVQKAVTLATADLILVKDAVVECARANYDGISIRVLTDYLTGSDQLVTRTDVLFGYLYIRPQWLCAVADKV